MKKNVLKYRFFFALCFLFFIGFPFCFSQELDDFDSLFDDVQDILVEETEEPAVSLSDQFDGYKPLTFSGSLKSNAGGVVGFEDWSVSGYFDLSNTLSFSARANRNMGLRGSFTVSYPAFSFALDELFFDYLFFDTLYMQAGKQKITWGNARIFSGNILENSEKGLSLKLYMPIWKGGLSGVVMTQSAWGNAAYPGWENMSFAVSADIPIGPVSIQIFGRKWATLDPIHGDEKAEPYMHRHPLFGIELKSTVFGFEIYQHAIMHIPFSSNSAPLSDQTMRFISGIAREWVYTDMPKFIIHVEYMYERNAFVRPIINDNRISVSFAVSRLFNNTSKFAVQWKHAFFDNSGMVIPGFIYAGLPNLEVQLGFPIIYGKEDSIYVAANEDPQKRKSLFAAKLSFSMSY